jgi:hypothetical protein
MTFRGAQVGGSLHVHSLDKAQPSPGWISPQKPGEGGCLHCVLGERTREGMAHSKILEKGQRPAWASSGLPVVQRPVQGKGCCSPSGGQP